MPGFWSAVARLAGRTQTLGYEHKETSVRPSRTAVPLSQGIVIWDLENCGIPACYTPHIPSLVRALRSTFLASRVVTTAAVSPSTVGLTEQLRAVSHCDVEVLTFVRPAKSSITAKKHNNADYLLKRVLHVQTMQCCLAEALRHEYS